tara:strand:- start:917 stop:1648 length:732 start_codon:yes stop_codon:yes gene_type:complete
MGSYKIQFSRIGSSTLIINWPQIISIEISENINQFIDHIKANLYLEEVRGGYCSVLIIYKSREINYEDLCKILFKCYLDLNDSISIKKHVWEIPVCYDDYYGIDLEEYSEKISISKQEIISLHSKKTYYLHMYGFIPGFMYLGGLDKKLFIRRKDKPSRNIIKGSVAIGGSQTGIYPSDSPGGWYVIGNSPLNFFELGKKKSPVIVPAGDFIKFLPISKSEFKKIEVFSKEGKYIINKRIYND